MKQAFIEVLRNQGAVKAGVSEPVWTGAPHDQIDDNALYAVDSHRELFELPSTRRLLETIYGEPVYLFSSKDIRLRCPETRSI